MTDKITEWQHISVGPPSAKASIADLQSMIDVATLKAGKPTFIGATVNGVEQVMIPKALYDEWVSANDAALDWADANARAFPIETAPMQRWIEAWDAQTEKWRHVYFWTKADMENPFRIYTHWREPLPPPSNPPLPAPLEALGAVLRRVKGVG